MQKMELNLEKIDGVKEIVYRNPPSAPIELPNMDMVEGDINTISAFLKKRYPCPSTADALGMQFVDKDRVVVTVDRGEFEIIVELDPEHPRGTVVKGKLSLAPELEKFFINSNKSFTREELVKLIRFNKIWFANRGEAETLLNAYMAFRADVVANIGKTNDTRGNVDNSYKKTVNTNIPLTFALNVPVFKGQGKRKFLVEIDIDATDAHTRFWLVSVELSDLIQIESEQILQKELECCKDFVVVYK